MTSTSHSKEQTHYILQEYTHSTRMLKTCSIPGRIPTVRSRSLPVCMYIRQFASIYSCTSADSDSHILPRTCVRCVDYRTPLVLHSLVSGWSYCILVKFRFAVCCSKEKRVSLVTISSSPSTHRPIRRSTHPSIHRSIGLTVRGAIVAEGTMQLLLRQKSFHCLCHLLHLHHYYHYHYYHYYYYRHGACF